MRAIRRTIGKKKGRNRETNLTNSAKGIDFTREKRYNNKE